MLLFEHLSNGKRLIIKIFVLKLLQGKKLLHVFSIQVSHGKVVNDHT